VFLSDVEKPTGESILDAEGLPVLRNHPTVLFGDGETFKSMVALWTAGNLSRAGMKVLYADWELDAADHRSRLEALFGHPLPPVKYLRCHAPILSMASRLREICQQEGIHYWIIDSVAFAVGVGAETSEAATSYYAALRQVGVGGSLSIAHTTKKVANRDRGKEKPFGSVFWHNGARMTWLATPVLRKQGFASVQLDCRKSNLIERPGRRLAKITFRQDATNIVIDAGELEVEQANNEQPPAKPLTASDRIDQLLRRSGPLTRADIQKSLVDVSPDTLRMAIKRGEYQNLDGDRLWTEARLGPLEEWEKANRNGQAPEHEHEQEP